MSEHACLANSLAFVRRLAILETANAGLRGFIFQETPQCGVGKARAVPEGQNVAVGDFVYFYRLKMYNPQRSGRPGRLLLNTWHGPALVI